MKRCRRRSTRRANYRSLGPRNGVELQRVAGVSMRHQHHRTRNKHTPCNRYSKHPNISFHEDALPIYNDESLHLDADGRITWNAKACSEGLTSSYSASRLWKAPLGRGRHEQDRAD
jgi:hypothetical protein